MKEKVLRLLKKSTEAISGEQISRELGVSRAAVWKTVEQLREEGCVIDASTRRGYKLLSAPDVLHASLISVRMDTHPWAARLHVMQTVDSTNNVLKTLAAQGAPEGTAVLAENQTAGRGRRGRSFFSPAGEGLYLSVLLRPQVRPDQLMHLTAMTAVAACRAVEKVCGVCPSIKWTNDLVCGGKKLAGILTELSLVAETMETDYVVVGIGLNCAQTQFPEDLREIATSLRMQCGMPVDRNELAAELLKAFSEMEQGLLREKAAWLREFSERCVNIGKEVVLLRGDTTRTARAVGIGTDAELLVEYEDGTKEAISSGEVSVRGMYGYV